MAPGGDARAAMHGGALRLARVNPERPTTPPARTLPPEIQAELDSGLAFMYDWPLGEGVETPLVSPELPSIHLTRAQLAEPVVRPFLERGDRSRALDIACHEGWFSHRLLEWGASEVVAVDIRDVNVRRAELFRDHSGIDAGRLQVRQGDVYSLDPGELGRFDVVLLLGLIYHLENPIAAIRVARDLCDGVCILETQLTRSPKKLKTGNGVYGQFEDEAAVWVARFEPPHEQATQPLASIGGVISLIPNEAAVVQAMQVAGFTRVERLQPAKHHNKQYRQADRGVFAGYVD